MTETYRPGRPPLEADATPIGRDWVEYANALERKLSAAQAALEQAEQRAAKLQRWLDVNGFDPAGILAAEKKRSSHG